MSFGLPVRNAAGLFERAVDSLLAQTFEDFEVVLCDNASDDGTSDICRQYAEGDSRVRYIQNEEDIGQVDNVNRVLELAKGTYFRWIGADDWLEPAYAERCVEVIDANPNMVGVTTYQEHFEENGAIHYMEYDGPRLESDQPEVRFGRLLWFNTTDYRYIDPLYSLIRREAMMKTPLLQVIPRMDAVLAAELVLLGPFGHVPEMLAHRCKAAKKPQRLKMWHPTRHRELRPSTRRVCQALREILDRVDLTPSQRAACLKAIRRFYFRTSIHQMKRNGHAWRRRIAGVLKRGSKSGSTSGPRSGASS